MFNKGPGKSNYGKTPRKNGGYKPHNQRPIQEKKSHGKPQGEFFEAVLFFSGKGKPRLETEDGTRIEVINNNTGTAFHGDKVEAKIVNWGAEIISIKERGKTHLVGTIGKDENGQTVFLPQDRRFPAFFDITGEIPDQDVKVYAKILPWNKSDERPNVEISEIFGKDGDHEAEMRAIVADSGFDWSYPAFGIKEAEEMRDHFDQTIKDELPKRLDYRGVETFTIDPETAKDFDDALSVKENDGGTFDVGVHIADVSHFVTEKTNLDHEAKRRATSIYLVDRTIPMLPEAISADICSLRPNEERLAFSSIFTLTKSGEIIKRWFGRTVIRSDYRFTYKEAQESLDSMSGPHANSLALLWKYAQKLRGERISSGSILFDKEEIEVELDENFKPIGIHTKPRYNTQHLIEEWMLLANRAVAELMSEAIKKRDFPGFVYRIHDRPDRERIDMLSVFLQGVGYNPIDGKTIRGTDLNRLFSEIEGKSIEQLVKQTALRSMSKAIYSTKNVGHFGLAFADYTHFTSPIRRYPDILVHRLLDLHLKKKRPSNQEWMEYESLLSHCSAKEYSAEKAERESIRIKQLEFMSTRIGQKFQGVVTGVTEWGLYVEDIETKTSGLIHISALKDYFTYDETHFVLRGAESGMEYKLGDKLECRVKAVDIEARSADFEII